MVERSFTLIAGLVIAFHFVSTGFAEELTPELVKQKVIEASKLIAAEGDAALPKLNDPDGKFRFADGKGYLWVHNLEGIMLMHPIKPSMNGKVVLDMRDPHGFYFFVAFNETVEAHGKGWIPYAWEKPGGKEASPKISYCMLVRHGDEEYVVGSGIWDITIDDIKKLYPDDAYYEE